MSAGAVTIREHVREALIAARPNGLTMGALTETVGDTWSPHEVHNVVRRLWEVGELARRADGTFVLTTRAARQAGANDGDLDAAVKRVAERARRTGHEAR